jgi:hypothetical protein
MAKRKSVDRSRSIDVSIEVLSKDKFRAKYKSSGPRLWIEGRHGTILTSKQLERIVPAILEIRDGLFERFEEGVDRGGRYITFDEDPRKIEKYFKQRNKRT